MFNYITPSKTIRDHKNHPNAFETKPNICRTPQDKFQIHPGQSQTRSNLLTHVRFIRICVSPGPGQSNCIQIPCVHKCTRNIWHPRTKVNEARSTQNPGPPDLLVPRPQDDRHTQHTRRVLFMSWFAEKGQHVLGSRSVNM